MTLLTEFPILSLKESLIFFIILVTFYVLFALSEFESIVLLCFYSDFNFYSFCDIWCPDFDILKELTTLVYKFWFLSCSGTFPHVKIIWAKFPSSFVPLSPISCVLFYSRLALVTILSREWGGYVEFGARNQRKKRVTSFFALLHHIFELKIKEGWASRKHSKFIIPL